MMLLIASIQNTPSVLHSQRMKCSIYPSCCVLDIQKARDQSMRFCVVCDTALLSQRTILNHVEQWTAIGSILKSHQLPCAMIDREIVELAEGSLA
jgi:hypothetical protein